MEMKKWMKMGIALGTICALTACGSQSGTETTTSGTANSAAEVTTGAELSETPTGTKIVIVTNNASDGRDVWLQEHAEQAGFNIEIVSLGGSDATARVISEVNNPTTNVIWGPSEDLFTAMIEANALVEFTPSWADQVEGVSIENGYSWSYEIQPKLIVCNPDQYSEDTVPTNWSDLWEKEEFHGKYAVPTKFSGATNRAVIGGILSQYLDESGDLGVSDEGWEALSKYFEYGYKTPTGENDFENMASGKVPITFTYASGLKFKSESFDCVPVIAYTEVGEPTNTNQIGVVYNGNQELVEESMRFVNWIGSAEVIGEYASEFGNIVANAEAVEYMAPIMQEIQKNYKALETDWSYINSMMDQWVAKIELEIY